MNEPPFSRRHGLAAPAAGTLLHEIAPSGLRTTLFEVLSTMSLNSFGGDFDGVRLRNLFCKVMNIRPNLENSDGLLAFREAEQLIYECEWYQFYEIVEELYRLLRREDGLGTGLVRAPQRGVLFANTMNEELVRLGIGWRLADGKVFSRGNEIFENTVTSAAAVLHSSSKPTAAEHLQFALDALSARPKANTGGAVAHATSAVECVLGEITGQAMTLGKYLDKYPTLFHPALKRGLDGIYGYASDEGARHGKEGIVPTREDAEFTLAVCAAFCTLLVSKRGA
jgi:hypothetical protein